MKTKTNIIIKQMNNILDIKKREEFREWLLKNSDKEKECYIMSLRRGKPIEGEFFYIDAVEEALCFGWIDSTFKNVDGVLYQRFSPRNKKSNWTLLNIERCKRLERLGLMTEKGKSIVPKEEYIFDIEVIEDIKDAGIYDLFINLPSLYQKIRVFNLSSIKSYSKEKYYKSLKNFIDKTKDGKLIDGWNDYGRLE